MSDSRTTEVEEILRGSPSRFAFRLLRALLDSWPDPVERERAIHRAAMVLERWPVKTRHAMESGFGPMSALLRRPSWPLVRSLRWAAIAKEGEGGIDRAIADLAADPSIKQLRRLELDYPEDEVLQGFHLPTYLPNLTRLDIELGCDNRRQAVIPLLNGGLPGRLRHLTLNGIESLDDGITDDVPEVVDAIASSPVGRRLRAVRLPNMSEATLAHFLARFRWPLRDIGKQNWFVESFERFCRHQELISGLTQLDLMKIHPGPEGFSVLARCPDMGRLEQLKLAGNSLGPDDVATLAGSPIVANLRWLDMVDNPLGDDGWEILGRAPFRRLRGLILSYTGATASGARALAGSRYLDDLRFLILNGNHIGDEGLSAILRAPFAMHLLHLNLAGTGKTAEAAEALASRPLARLRTLDIGWEFGAGPEFGRRLARASVYPSLTSLQLKGLELGDAGVEFLAKATGFPHVRRLSLWNNNLTNRGIRALTGSPFVSPVRDLSLSGNPRIDDAGVIALAESPVLRNLIDLDLDRGTKMVGREALEILRSAPSMSLLDSV